MLGSVGVLFRSDLDLLQMQKLSYLPTYEISSYSSTTKSFIRYSDTTLVKAKKWSTKCQIIQKISRDRGLQEIRYEQNSTIFVDVDRTIM